ncbi:MAG: glucosylglycerol-phosphate synthase [Gammaproteobacteria bacterium RIFCSPHIGHO2_12_FULL_63_22]|nr:MAG: glucosylglycerol-phosphate synthase [Gammaproteobacteria bacterium RIFCSPHIGHO2_12_FULL_63_22]
MLLATDLDGTFLAGDAGDRRQLYRLLANHPGIHTAWVTGRGLETVLPLLSDPLLPRPDYVVCDVGATVIATNDMQPLQPLQSDIESRWPGEQVVVEGMSGFEPMVRQDVPQQRRCSYYCQPGELASMRLAIEAQASLLSCDVLYSADRYLDILPRDTNKGSTLLALTELLGIAPANVLVAGDTLNDLSMFGVGFRGVCVAESEPALLAATDQLPQVLHAQSPGCGGILEAIRHFGMVDEAIDVPDLEGSIGKADLVMVYHRLPYEEKFVQDKVVRQPHSSPNGIIPSLLSFFGDGHPGSWVAWSVAGAEGESFKVHTAVDAARYPLLTAARVPLSKEQVDVFYKRFSKEAFWPIINTFWERARFVESDWQVFKQVNRLFAEATAAEAAPGATVWLHDYNLWMVPSTLRELRPDLNIAFFHHTHFPTGDIFNIIPWRREILGSLLACDYIGFQIPRHVENFVDTLRGAAPVEVVSRVSCAPRFLTYGCCVGLESMPTEVRAQGRSIRLGAHPISTDVEKIEGLLAMPAVRKHVAAIREEIGARKLVLSIERLDYGKGILEKLRAFELLLEREPDLRGEVTLVVVCVPAAREMTVYRELQAEIEQSVGRINGRLSRLDWTPVRFFARALPFDSVIAHYAAADVMWITPLRDGMNLVAKEFVATQGLTNGKGVLVLSEFAGAAAELKGALLTNPHDSEEMVSTLRLALTMGEAERDDRQRTLFDIVRHYDLSRWGHDFLHAARGTETADSPEAVAA